MGELGDPGSVSSQHSEHHLWRSETWFPILLKRWLKQADSRSYLALGVGSRQLGGLLRGGGGPTFSPFPTSSGLQKPSPGYGNLWLLSVGKLLGGVRGGEAEGENKQVLVWIVSGPGRTDTPWLLPLYGEAARS